MKFTKSKISSVDFSNLQEGDVANATFKNFRFIKDYIVGDFIADNEIASAIIAKRGEIDFQLLKELKGSEVEITFGGTKVSEGKTYPRYYLAW